MKSYKFDERPPYNVLERDLAHSSMFANWLLQQPPNSQENN